MATGKETAEKISGLTRDDLLALIAAIRVPVKTEKDIRDEKERENDRAQMMEMLKQARANKLAEQKACTHCRRDGSTAAVYIVDINRLYCQHCQKWILPNEEPELFNRLYQLAI